MFGILTEDIQIVFTWGVASGGMGIKVRGGVMLWTMRGPQGQLRREDLIKERGRQSENYCRNQR